MGLDNGFVVKSKKRRITRDMLPEEIILPFTSDYDGEVSIVYWRKNWGLRNSIIKLLGMKNGDGTYEIDTPNQIFNILDIIFTFKNKRIWEDEGDSIWEYNEIEPILKRDIINLTLMIPFMKDNPDIYLEFYDSY